MKENLIFVLVLVLVYVGTVWFFNHKIYNINKKINPFKLQDISYRYDKTYAIKSKHTGDIVAKEYTSEQAKTKLLEYNKLARIQDLPDLTDIKSSIRVLENPPGASYIWKIWESGEVWKWEARNPKTSMAWNDLEPNWWLAQGEALTSDLARNDVVTAIRSHQLEMISPTKLSGYSGTVRGKFQR